MVNGKALASIRGWAGKNITGWPVVPDCDGDRHLSLVLIGLAVENWRARLGIACRQCRISREAANATVRAAAKTLSIFSDVDVRRAAQASMLPTSFHFCPVGSPCLLRIQTRAIKKFDGQKPADLNAVSRN
jgi:hypothetical protein